VSLDDGKRKNSRKREVMAWVWITLIGLWATRFSYRMSLERGKHRRVKRGWFDYADGKWRRDMMELAELIHTDRGWTGVGKGVSWGEAAH
jgi:hypothetical protein